MIKSKIEFLYEMNSTYVPLFWSITFALQHFPESMFVRIGNIFIDVLQHPMDKDKRSKVMKQECRENTKQHQIPLHHHLL